MTIMDELLSRVDCLDDDCKTYQFGMRNADTLAHFDSPFLLALVRDLEARIERVEALADTLDGLGSHASYHGTEAEMETWLSAANQLRAALTATEGAA